MNAMGPYYWWLGAISQQAIIWINAAPDLCRHMVSLGHNDLIVLLGVEYFDAAEIHVISFVESCMLLAVEIDLFILK